MINVTKIIKNPRITEKASDLMADGAYTFDVTDATTKTEVKKAVYELYKVKPVKVNILSVKSKQVFSRGKWGTKSGGRKAVVYLKEGDKIEFI